MLYNRQKLLLQLIDLIDKHSIHSKLYTMKTIFLLRQKFGFENVSYDFYPYKHGPFSNIVYKDINYLISQNLLESDEKTITTKGNELIEKTEFAIEIENEAKNILLEFKTTDSIKEFVYSNYPQFTVKSASPRKTMQKEHGICSIGYEGKSIDTFLNQLIQNNITLLVDVRNNPFSMKREFCADKLNEYLKNCGIEYLHIPELGIESEKRKELNSETDYKELFEEYESKLYSKELVVDKIRKLGKEQKIALMCFEADKNCCHRGTLSEHLACGVEHL